MWVRPLTLALLLVCLLRVELCHALGGNHEKNLNDAGGAMPSYPECNASYGRRDYLWETEMKKPPMLLTFPGSGTTMTQMLLEFATGVYSGSIYDEDELYPVMPGLRNCGQRLSVIKAHVKDILFKQEKGEKEEKVTFKTSRYVAKCRNGIIYEFNRFIIVLRSPWAAWWSNWQRDFNTQREDRNTHTGGIPLHELNYTAWEEAALYSPHYGVGMYNTMWNTTYPKLFKKNNYSRADDMNFGNTTFHNSLQESVSRAARRREILQQAEQQKMGQHSSTPYTGYTGNKNLLIVRYEDLLHTERRLHVLRKMVEFTGNGLKRASYWLDGGILMENEKNRLKGTTTEAEELRRLKCAFVLADNPNVHRKKAGSGNTMARSGDAYKHEKLVCSAWKALQNSSIELQRYGYFHGPHQHVPIPQCDGVEVDLV